MMNEKLFIPLISLGSLMGPTITYAQSSVSLYGRLDSGLSFIKTSTGNQYGAFSGGMFGDRWGFKGKEDLGNGLAAIFQLENGFSITTGQLRQGGRLFGRQAYAGLADKDYGTITLGRQYDPVVDLVQPQTADITYGASFGTPGDIDNYDNTVRISNSVKYVSPTYRGFTFEALYGLGGAAGAPGESQSWSGAARFVAGPFSFAAGYLHSSNANGQPARSAWTSTTSDTFFSSPINNGYQTASSVGIARAAAEYVKDKVTVGVSYSNVQATRDSQSTFASNEHWNVGTAFSSYQLTPAAAVGLSYTYTHASGDTSATYHQVNTAATYSFSRRTETYAVAGYQHASGLQRVATGGTREAQASIGSFGIAGSSTQVLAIVGILHRF